MTQDDLLLIVSKYHSEWLSTVHALCTSMVERDNAEDFIQEMYLKIHKYAKADKVAPDGALNKGYIFFALKSILNSFRMYRKNINKIPIDECYECKEQPENTENSEDLYPVLQQVDQTIKDLHWYDQRIFSLHVEDGKSIRAIAKETRISHVSSQRTISSTKTKIHEQAKKKYQEIKKRN